MLIAVTDLPEPDSPTIANTSPRCDVEETPSTALHVPSSVSKLDLQVADREQHCLVHVIGPSSFGSSASRRPSPTKHEREHGEEDRQAREEEQVRRVGEVAACPRRPSGPTPGVGSCGPTPRNDSAASARITPPTAIVPYTMIGWSAFGRMCRNMIRVRE